MTSALKQKRETPHSWQPNLAPLASPLFFWLCAPFPFCKCQLNRTPAHQPPVAGGEVTWHGLSMSLSQPRPFEIDASMDSASRLEEQRRKTRSSSNDPLHKRFLSATSLYVQSDHLGQPWTNRFFFLSLFRASTTNGSCSQVQACWTKSAQCSPAPRRSTALQSVPPSRSPPPARASMHQ